MFILQYCDAFSFLTNYEQLLCKHYTYFHPLLSPGHCTVVTSCVGMYVQFAA